MFAGDDGSKHNTKKSGHSLSKSSTPTNVG